MAKSSDSKPEIAIEPDADLSNADWPKKTDDRLETLLKEAEADAKAKKDKKPPAA